jgi:hypothetical protein
LVTSNAPCDARFEIVLSNFKTAFSGFILMSEGPDHAKLGSQLLRLSARL